MTQLQTYHRPTTIEEALALLNRPGVNAVALAGGTNLVGKLAEGVDEVVDLQAVGLNRIEHKSARMIVGAMTRLQTIVDDPRAPQILRQAAHREGPNTFRNMGTIGGVVALADWESELLAALLALEAEVTLQSVQETQTMLLSDFLAAAREALKGRLITSISVATEGKMAAERVARTPADKAIVAAVARRTPDDRLLLALSGVDSVPRLVSPDDLDALTPPADFRGSSAYRKTMARVLSERVLARIER
ncbi:MAG: hypothetical protein GXP42_10400 [Chloroflexi bacterium]|nr:hypothetical protein [Chloroflexota bacterium]